MWDEIAKGAVEGLVRGILSRKSDKPAGHVEAQSFVLRDDEGRGRAVLAMLDGGPGLTLLNSGEQIKAVLGVGEDEAYLELWGSGGKANALVRMEGDEPELVFFDDEGRARASLRLFATGPCLRLFDANSKCRAMMELNPEDQPSVVVFDENEQPMQEMPE
jgi:hypothetical protein